VRDVTDTEAVEMLLRALYEGTASDCPWVRDWGVAGEMEELAYHRATDALVPYQCLLITLASDGEDGPTDAAGAAATGATLARSATQNLDPQKYLQEHNSYLFFEQLEDLIKIGPTHTNVNDLYFLFTV